MPLSLHPSVTRVDDTHAGKPLLELMADRFPRISRETWNDRFARGMVLVGGRAAGASDAFPPGTVVEYYREIEREPDVPKDFKIIHQESDFMVIDKPPGLPTVPCGEYVNANLVTMLKMGNTGSRSSRDEDGSVPRARSFVSAVNRLDMDTGGLCLVALDGGAARHFDSEMRSGNVGTRYLAVVDDWDASRHVPFTIDLLLARDMAGGNPKLTRVVGADHPGAKRCITVVEKATVLVDPRDVTDGNGDRGWLLQLHPVTGRQHQIRVSLASMGSPIRGDRLYGRRIEAGEGNELDDGSRERRSEDSHLALISWKLVFATPDGRRMEFTSSLASRPPFI